METWISYALKKIRDHLGIFPDGRIPPPLWEFQPIFTHFVGQGANFWVILMCFKGFLRLWLG